MFIAYAKSVIFAVYFLSSIQMKRVAIALYIIALCVYGWAQPSRSVQISYPQEINEIAQIKNDGKILLIRSGSQVSYTDFLEKYYDYFGLTTPTDWIIKDQINRPNGGSDYRCQQYYHGIPIVGATLLLHERDGKVTACNGTIVPHFARPFTPLITPERALESALKQISATQYAWENPILENDLKSLKNDPQATYYPTPTLAYFDPNYTYQPQNYRLAYAIDIFAMEPFGRKIVYVDASNGAVIKVVSKSESVQVEVQAETRYDGVRTIVVDSVAPNQFYLREESRGAGNGIVTKTLNHTGSMAFIDTSRSSHIIESDNYFDEDRAANSAHFGAERTYDYYYEKFGRNSIDNQGLRLTSYVHWGNNIENAAWANNAMFYGDGRNGYELTITTVCGHEITHGLTEYTADLVYEYESGALNEAFSDILGVMIAYFATDTLKWSVGDELQTPYRDLSNPKAYRTPHTYLGQYWWSDASDNGGVHTNSAVAGYWFYLLCEGGSGVNDNQTPYQVSGIGTAAAESIVYTTLTSYLTETSNYHDVYELSLMAAEDLYGACSPEVKAVAAAWRAVGIGRTFSDSLLYIDEILTPNTACALDSEEPVTLVMTYNSCNRVLPAGSEIHVRLRLDQTIEKWDTITLPADSPFGQPFNLTLNQTLDLSTVGTHSLDVWIKPSFMSEYTDSLLNYTFENLEYQNSDVTMVAITAPLSSCFLSQETEIACQFSFNICDTISAGTPIALAYVLNYGDTVRESFVLPQRVTAADTLSYHFAIPADFTQAAVHNLTVIATMEGDPNISNNEISQLIYRPRTLNEIETLTFDESDYPDFYYMEKGAYVNSEITTLRNYNGGYLIKMTGGNIMDYMMELEFPDTEEELWEAMPELNTRVVLCADATDMADFALSFDLKQTSGKPFYEYYLGSQSDIDLLASSMLRVLVDGEQVGDVFIPRTPSSDPFTPRTIDLSEYAGAKHEIVLESKCFSSDLFTYKLDNVYVDNISILHHNSVNNFTQQAEQIKVFPNPTQGILTIETTTSALDGREVYRLYDLYGKKLKEGVIHNPQMRIDISTFATGVYLLEIAKGEQVIRVDKIIKTIE